MKPTTKGKAKCIKCGKMLPLNEFKRSWVKRVNNDTKQLYISPWCRDCLKGDK